MPPKSRRKASGKPPPVIVKQDGGDDADSQEAAATFQREVTWCVEQLTLGLQNCNLQPGSMAAERKVIDTAKQLKTLQSKDAAMIKKRSLMQRLFGDYRAKMAAEELKVAEDAESIDMKSVSVSEQNRTAQVLHKSANKENDVGILNFDIEKDSDLTLDSITKTMTECVLKDSEKSQRFVMKKNADEFKFNFTEPEIKNDCV